MSESPKCPINLFLFFLNVILVKEIVINSKINKYLKTNKRKILKNELRKKKCRTLRDYPKVPKRPTTQNVR